MRTLLHSPRQVALSGSWKRAMKTHAETPVCFVFSWRRCALEGSIVPDTISPFLPQTSKTIHRRRARRLPVRALPNHDFAASDNQAQKIGRESCRERV